MADRNERTVTRREPERPERKETRSPIWGIPPQWIQVYSVQLLLFLTLGFVFIIWYEVVHQSEDSLSETIYEIIRGIVLAAAASAVISYYSTEAVRYTMIFAGMLEEQLRRNRERQIAEAVDEAVAVARAEARQEGRAETNARWQAWLERKLEAEANGEPFNEPPPNLSE